jgi:hypothetical protein
MRRLSSQGDDSPRKPSGLPRGRAPRNDGISPVIARNEIPWQSTGLQTSVIARRAAPWQSTQRLSSQDDDSPRKPSGLPRGRAPRNDGIFLVIARNEIPWQSTGLQTSVIARRAAPWQSMRRLSSQDDDSPRKPSGLPRGRAPRNDGIFLVIARNEIPWQSTGLQTSVIARRVAPWQSMRHFPAQDDDSPRNLSGLPRGRASRNDGISLVIARDEVPWQSMPSRRRGRAANHLPSGRGARRRIGRSCPLNPSPPPSPQGARGVACGRFAPGRAGTHAGTGYSRRFAHARIGFRNGGVAAPDFSGLRRAGRNPPRPETAVYSQVFSPPAV